MVDTKYVTYVSVGTHYLTANKKEGFEEITDVFERIFDRLFSKDEKAKVLPFSKDNEKYNLQNNQPYSFNDFNEVHPGKKIRAFGKLLLYLNNYIHSIIGRRGWTVILVAHSEEFHYIFDDFFIDELKDSMVSLKPDELQCNSRGIACWFLGANAPKTDLSAMNNILKTHPQFRNLPVAAGITHLKCSKDDQHLQVKDPKAVPVVVLFTSKNRKIRDKLFQQASSVFNKKQNTSLRPLGFSWTPFEWKPNKNFLSDEVKEFEYGLRSRQKKFYSAVKSIQINGITELDIALKLKNGRTMTL